MFCVFGIAFKILIDILLIKSIRHREIERHERSYSYQPRKAIRMFYRISCGNVAWFTRISFRNIHTQEN